MLGALDTVEMEYRAGSLAPIASDEDVHTLIERRVTELAGDAGAKLHTGRSRNDQVATALRHYVMRDLAVIAGRVLDLVDVLSTRADEAGPATTRSTFPATPTCSRPSRSCSRTT